VGYDPARMRRLSAVLPLSLVTFLLLAPAALAESDHGEGWWGETNDKVVTNFGFLLIAFFPVFVLCMSLLQNRLEKRKEAHKRAVKARAARKQTGGW
jgi:preprotein translocase subunit SecG